MTTSRVRAAPLLDREVRIETDRESLTDALERSEERFQLLAHRVGLGVYRVSLEGRLIEVNPALVRMLGYACESELLALDVQRDLFVDFLDYERLRLRLAHGAVERVAARWKRKDGAPVTVRLSVRPVSDGRGGIAFHDGVAEDVTERVRHQESLRRTERMAALGATLAGVAHELNNPLAAILGFAQLLLKKGVDAEARLALETIDHEASRAGKIVRDLLTLARKREAERRVRLDLNDVVGYIVRTRRYALETHGVRCLTHFGDNLPAVIGDRTQLEQIILNLLNNAEAAIRAARDDGGRVYIRTRGEGLSAVLEIEDDGVGVPDEVRERIWDPFWTTKGVGAGTGLGLAVVRDIVVGHGGEIAVERGTTLDGARGARFIVRLPGVCGHGADASELLAEAASRALDVLVVEPDAQNANFLTAFLASRGHAALAARDIDCAVRLANHLPFDAVICDAGVAGGASLAAFRSASGCRSARFIVAAGDPASTARLPLPLPAATALVMRPYDLEELRVLLED